MIKKTLLIFILSGLAGIYYFKFPHSINRAHSSFNCDIVIAGGSTAALGAALSASKEIALLDKSSPRKVCLVEPTDLVGGQLTSGGTPAVDFAFHKTKENPAINSAGYSRKFQNNSRYFADWMKILGKTEKDQFVMPDSGTEPCWVSVRCIHPRKLQDQIDNAIKKYVDLKILTVFKDSVIKKITTKNRKIYTVEIISRRRTNKPFKNPMDERLSQTLEDWYSNKNSKYFTKETIVLKNKESSAPLASVIEASEWGEILTLASASYIQGRELDEDSPFNTEEMCGQAITYPIAIKLNDRQADLPNWATKFKNSYTPSSPFSLNDVSGSKFSWDDVWTYRRLVLGEESKNLNRFLIPKSSSGDISMQNWTAGNDYLDDYIFLSREDSAKQITDWKGGINFNVLDKSEKRSLGWMLYLNDQAPKEFKEKLSPSDILGHDTGLSKYPYMRDTRRSVAIDDFSLRYRDHLAKGYKFDDTVVIGVYAADIHELTSSKCGPQPKHIKDIKDGKAYPPPFYLPLRAHTNKDIDNLLTAGKTISQTFAANSATRLHPIEFSSGVAAGVTAALMARDNLLVPEIIKNKSNIKKIQMRLSEKEKDGRSRHSSIEWMKPKG